MKPKHFILPVAAAFLLGGCSVPFLSKGVEQMAKTAEQKAAEQEILKNCTYDKSICQYMVAQMNAFSSGLTMTSTMVFAGRNQGLDTETVTKMDGQGNMQSTSNRDGKETSNMIIFGDATYILDYQDSKWMKMTVDKDEADTSSLAELGSIEAIKEQFDPQAMQMIYTKIGEEPCDPPAKLTCEIYEMSEQGNSFGKTKIWIDTKEYLSRKTEMTMNDGSVNTITYSYGSVSISEPSPVKEFEIPSYNMGGPGQMPSQAEIQKMMEDLPVEIPTE